MNSIKLFISKKTWVVLLPIILLSLSSCYTYSTQEPALVQNVDVDQTLKVAYDEMQKKDISQSLGI